MNREPTDDATESKELEISYFPKWKSNDRGRGRSLPGGMPQHSIR